MPQTDADLLRDFTQQRSQAAFAEIVGRYSDLVFAAARRQVADPATAEDITQAVFLVLAQKSASIKPDRLPAWLLATTRLCARRAIRTQTRRTYHEREAAMSKPQSIAPAKLPDPLLAATLDDAMSRLPARACAAIAMRHLQNRSVKDVAATIGVSPDAAQKILARGLSKLRKILLRKGVALPSVAALTAAMLHESARTAPAQLLLSPSTATASAVSIAKGATNMILCTTLKLSAATIAASVLLTGAGSFVLIKSLSEITAAQAVSQTPPPQPPGNPATLDQLPPPAPAPTSVAPFDSPFLELAGCRIVQHVRLKLSAQPSAVSAVEGVAEQYSVVSWSIDSALAANVNGYSVTVMPTADPTSARTFQFDKSTDRQPVPYLLNLPGEYDINVSAIDSNSKSIASAAAHVTIKPLPYTQIQIDDVLPDGICQFAYVDQAMNDSGNAITQEPFSNSDIVHVQTMSDVDGNPLRFTSQHIGDMYRYKCYFKTPIQPGEPQLWSNAGTMSHIIRNLGNGVFVCTFRHYPGSNFPTRRIELYRLPAGATLLYMSDNLQRKIVDGRPQIFMETTIPVGGSNLVEFRYRLANP
jgi:RNA polymerase sigma factor (sigma-70 family)